MKKILLLVVCVFAVPFILWGQESLAENTQKQDLRPDTTIVCLLDGKQIPYKLTAQKMIADEVTWVTGAPVPRDAIRYFGIAGMNGLYVFVTKKKGEAKDEE